VELWHELLLMTHLLYGWMCRLRHEQLWVLRLWSRMLARVVHGMVGCSLHLNVLLLHHSGLRSEVGLGRRRRTNHSGKRDLLRRHWLVVRDQSCGRRPVNALRIHLLLVVELEHLVGIKRGRGMASHVHKVHVVVSHN